MEILDKQIRRVTQYQEIFVRAGRRFAKRLTNSSGDVDLQRKLMVQLIIIRKICGRALDNVYTDALTAKRRVERDRKKLNQPWFKARHYNGLIKKMKPIKLLIDENSQWITETLTELKINGIVLTDNELQTALSIPRTELHLYSEWR